MMFLFIFDDLKYDNVWYIIREESKKNHGIDDEIIRHIENNEYDLIILPDGGSNDFEYHKKIKELGCDILILDHHIYDTDKTTDAIIINNQDGQVENKDLSGCGVTYKMIDKYCELNGIDLGDKYLDLVALSLVADMCSMKSLENRYLLNLGSKVSKTSNNLIKSFIKDLKLKKKISIENYSFGIAPVLNSIIRMADVKEKEDLFESLINNNENVEYKYRGKVVVQSISDSILRIGKRLKRKQNDIINKALKEELTLLSDKNDKVVIIDGKDISVEIRGVLCNRLVNEYNKPVIIVSGDKIMQGSARGVNAIKFKTLCENSGLFEYCTGHLNAFGVSIKKDNINNFIEYINKELANTDLNNYTEIDYVYEGNIPLEDILLLKTDLEDLWCNQIKRPKLLIKNIKINSKNIKKRGIDLSFKIDDILYKKDFCSNEFYKKLIDKENNKNINKDLIIDAICEVKITQNNKAYINLIETETRVV